MSGVRLIAPAKINWTLEVLGRRDDGYHEVRSVMQTVNLHDTVELLPAGGVSIAVRGGTRSFRRRAAEAPETNLAYRAARLLRARLGVRSGVEIRLHKHVPIAAGLGGGSSDAAAVLRGLRALWDTDASDGVLREVAAELGSDVPFFVRGGTALASGRGETLEQLPDVRQPEIAIATRRGRAPDDKTARMYAALGAQHWSDGARSQALAARIRAGKPVREGDVCNAFEAVITEAAPAVAAAMTAARAEDVGTPHLCGSGPALFFFTKSFHAGKASATVYHNAFVPVQALSAAEATWMSRG